MYISGDGGIEEEDGLTIVGFVKSLEKRENFDVLSPGIHRNRVT